MYDANPYLQSDNLWEFNYPVFPLQCRIWLDMCQGNFLSDMSYGWLSFTALLKGKIIIFPLKSLKMFKQKCWGSNSADRAQNNGWSTDNVWTDWGVDWSTFCLAGQVDLSHLILLKIKKLKFQCCSVICYQYAASCFVLRNFDLKSWV